MTDPFEDLSPMERKNFKEKMKEIRLALLERRDSIESNFDEREKMVGDKVKIWDFSANLNKQDGSKVEGTDVYYKENEAIIVQEGLDIKQELNYLNEFGLTEAEKEFLKDDEPTIIDLDILIRYPNGVEIN